jgi:hypothetical protein
MAVLGYTGVQSRDLLDAFRIAAGLRGAGGNLTAKGLGFLFSLLAIDPAKL